jgi:N-acyl-D-aspartate/D-glutamate deacylase
MLDVLIKGGTIVDGLGGVPYVGDIGVKDGKIIEIGGKITTISKDEIDADGATVTPGFVDVHTHYDGQVTWDDQIEPSSSHGVTTAIMGNCGVGFAPVRKGGEGDLIELMEGVEDIPGTALHAGMPWGAWETFPEYLDFLADREFDMDIGAHVAHGALRAYVMGDRGIRNEEASASDIAEMAILVEQAISAGALGFSTSRVLGHRSINGEPVPGTFASRYELQAIVEGMVKGGHGVVEMIPSDAIGQLPHLAADPYSTDEEIDLMSSLSEKTGIPITFSMFQLAARPDEWRDAMQRCNIENDRGAHLYPQIASRPPGMLVSFAGMHEFMRRPTYLGLAELSHEQRIAELKKPTVKSAILAEKDSPPIGKGNFKAGLVAYLATLTREFYALGDPLDYEPELENSVGAIADRLGQSPASVMYDEMLKQDGSAFLMAIQTNYIEGNHDVIRQMIQHPKSVLGLGDGGAHVTFICDGSMQTYAMQHWVRDRHRGEKLPIELIVHKMTAHNADLYGLSDRGRLAVGMRADLNIIDLPNLNLHRPHMIYDLPGGNPRLMQPADGYLATIVNGTTTRRNSKDTGARPGRLVRGGGLAA